MKPQKRYSEDVINRLVVEQLEAMRQYFDEQPWEVVEEILRDSGEQL